MAGRSYKTEAVVLRSIRLGEADRVLHLYTSERGRIGAVAKGIRKTKSRFGGRLEPLSLVETGARPVGRPELDPLALSFQLKLLWLAGYLPHLTSCAECGTEDAPLIGYSPRTGGAVCRGCAAATQAFGLGADAVAAIEALLRRPLAEAGDTGLTERTARDALRVGTSSYEYHVGFRLRTLSA